MASASAASTAKSTEELATVEAEHAKLRREYNEVKERAAALERDLKRLDRELTATEVLGPCHAHSSLATQLELACFISPRSHWRCDRRRRDVWRRK